MLFSKNLVWNEVCRTQVRAELDAYRAPLYGLTREEPHCIFDSQDIYGEEFRISKEKEVKQFGMLAEDEMSRAGCMG
jgi:hypothetical protein